MRALSNHLSCLRIEPTLQSHLHLHTHHITSLHLCFYSWIEVCFCWAFCVFGCLVLGVVWITRGRWQMGLVFDIWLAFRQGWPNLWASTFGPLNCDVKEKVVFLFGHWISIKWVWYSKVTNKWTIKHYLFI